jgi:hypothetical protein
MTHAQWLSRIERFRPDDIIGIRVDELRELLGQADKPDLRSWLEGVARTWAGYWKTHPEEPPHRYKRDFAAFVGERLLTDFNLRDIEKRVRNDKEEE